MTWQKDYPLSAFPNGKVNGAVLVAEIGDEPAIVTGLVGGVTTVGTTVQTFWKYVLSAAELTALDALVAAHQGDPTPDSPRDVTVTNQPRTREDGVAYAVPKPSGFGLVMCDRDFKINTCMVTTATAVEDLKMNTQTNKEESWNELTLVNVFKSDGQGGMVACADQADADLNGILTAWDYHAKMPNGSPIQYEMRDGLLYVDPNLPVEETFSHRAYAIVAPLIPGAMGGSVAVFDAYLGANPDDLVAALSPQATVLDPSGPAGVAASTLRLYIVHPAGAKRTHVLRLVTYRAPGTF